MQAALTQAFKAQQQGEFQQADVLYQQIIIENPNSAEAWHYYAIFAAQQQQFSQALERIQKAIAIDSDSAEYYQTLGNILKKLNKLDEALQALLTAEKLETNNPEIHNQLAVLYYQQQNFDNALKHYAKAVQLKPDYVEAHFNLALLFIQQNNMDAAITQLKNVLTLFPENINAHKLLADLYLNSGASDQSTQDALNQAIKHYKFILELQPDFVDVINNLGVAYLKLNQGEAAVKCFTKVLSIDVKHIDARNNLAATYLQGDRYDNARTHYLELLKVDADNIEAHYNLGVCAMAIGELEQAQQAFNWVLQKNPENIDAAVNLAAVYLKLKNITAAVEQYKQVLKLNPQQPVANYMLHALQHDLTPDTAPAEYVRNLFDNYAGYYDKHIGEALHYQVPSLMREKIMALNNKHDKHNKPETPWRILDLGCGTGLAGEVFSDQAAYLYGIDISPKMLAYAKRKNIYQALQPGDINACLQDIITASIEKFDLIIAADVFVYLGELKHVFTACKQLLKNKGLFCFSVETLNETERSEPGKKIEFSLQQTARFAHSEKYLKRLIKDNDFGTVFFEKIILRYQDQEPVWGFLVGLNLR